MNRPSSDIAGNGGAGRAGLRYGSVCSGIEAASAAWKPLGWKCSFVSEIEAFPRAVLKHHYPETPLHGDFTTIREGEYAPIDVLVGGTPCQSFSVAGLRGGLADERGNLALEYLRLADRLRPKWLVWENVPGVLSSNGGRDFGSILGGMVQLGYGFAYRVLDAQFFGVPQRRRRVFVVGHLGDWRRAAAVLFERHSLQGHPTPRRQAGERAAPTISARPTGGGGLGTDFDCDGGLIQWPPEVAPSLYQRFGDKMGYENQHLDSLNGGLFTLAVRGREGGHNLEFRQDETSNAILTPNGGRAGMGVGAIAYALQERAGCENPNAGPDGAGYREGASYTLEARQTPQAVAWSIMPQNSGKDYKARAVDVAQPVMAGGPVGGNQGGDYIQQTVTAFNTRQDPIHGPVADPLGTKDNGHGILEKSAVRRLTPRECERLQGFPDDYTLIPWRKGQAPDGPRYKALGNSMAVPVMCWIGERIQAVEAISSKIARAA